MGEFFGRPGVRRALKGGLVGIVVGVAVPLLFMETSGQIDNLARAYSKLTIPEFKMYSYPFLKDMFATEYGRLATAKAGLSLAATGAAGWWLLGGVYSSYQNYKLRRQQKAPPIPAPPAPPE